MCITNDPVSAEWLHTGVPLVALVVSGLSLWFTRKLWVQSNRPIVTAAVRTHSGGNTAITYELAVINSGTRPATAVRLTANIASVKQAMDIEPNAFTTPELTHSVEQILCCFSCDAEIPLLLNGQTLTNYFGHTGNAGGIGSLWRFGASFPVVISYSDIEGRSFRSNVKLVIKDTAGFAGSFFSE